MGLYLSLHVARTLRVLTLFPPRDALSCLPNSTTWKDRTYPCPICPSRWKSSWKRGLVLSDLEWGLNPLREGLIDWSFFTYLETVWGGGLDLFHFEHWVHHPIFIAYFCLLYVRVVAGSCGRLRFGLEVDIQGWPSGLASASKELTAQPVLLETCSELEANPSQ